MKKLLTVLALIISLTAPAAPLLAQGTILPKAGERNEVVDCDGEIDKYIRDANFDNILIEKDELLGCAITTGRVSLPMIPYFIQYFSNYALGLVSILALLFIVIGGFLYTLGGMTEQKDKGKNFIKNAIIGMIIAFMAWTIVNVIISAVTG